MNSDEILEEIRLLRDIRNQLQPLRRKCEQMGYGQAKSLGAALNEIDNTMKGMYEVLGRAYFFERSEFTSSNDSPNEQDK